MHPLEVRIRAISFPKYFLLSLRLGFRGGGIVSGTTRRHTGTVYKGA